MDEATVAALLGRPLTANETTNFDLYLDIATDNLEDLLCFSLDEEPSERVFNGREGYSTLFIDPFTSVSEVIINGSAVADTEYTSYLWNKRNANWFNSLVFNDTFNRDDEITITASWGFGNTSGEDLAMPSDLQLLYAKLFALSSSGSKGDVSVQSKKVEDFSITYANADKTALQRLVDANSAVINKYSLCNIGEVQNGRVCI